MVTVHVAAYMVSMVTVHVLARRTRSVAVGATINPTIRSHPRRCPHLRHQRKLELVSGLVAANHRSDVAEAAPVPEDGGDSRARLPGEADAPKRRRDQRVADLLRRPVQQAAGRGVAVSRVPEHRPVKTEADEGHAPVVAVILVNELVDDRFAKDAYPGGSSSRLMVRMSRLNGRPAWRK